MLNEGRGGTNEGNSGPSDADALPQRGDRVVAWLLAERGQLDEARQLAETAARELPGQAEAKHTLGCVILKQGRPYEAIDCWRPASDSHPIVARTAMTWPACAAKPR